MTTQTGYNHSNFQTCVSYVLFTNSELDSCTLNKIYHSNPINQCHFVNFLPLDLSESEYLARYSISLHRLTISVAILVNLAENNLIRDRYQDDH
jgi:hypothetical protein